MPAAYAMGYAYPTSINAKMVGRSARGAYTVKSAEGFEGFDTFPEAKTRADALRAQGCEPDRWSLDHPKNQHLYPELFA